MIPGARGREHRKEDKEGGKNNIKYMTETISVSLGSSVCPSHPTERWSISEGKQIDEILCVLNWSHSGTLLKCFWCGFFFLPERPLHFKSFSILLLPASGNPSGVFKSQRWARF